MKTLRNLAGRPAAAPLVADDVLEFHAARLLLLLSTCGGATGAISGLTKMAKLDFFVRYPDFFRAVESHGKSTREDGAVEAAMIRHHYGPWDKRYYHLLAYLEARQLISVSLTGRAYRIALTALGKTTAKKLVGSDSFADLLKHMRDVNEKFGRKTGNELKTLIYETFGEEVAEQELGSVISGGAR
ncbi:hypothetical protein [Bradyrhizobium sp. DASA03120]|uniref:hypothetical protein n=1 Tax=Bradyrhizobium sp. SMVTL-02 TaxID=3395917 RepID=UPI003F71B6D3